MVLFWLFMALAVVVIVGNALLLLRSGSPLKKSGAAETVKKE